MDKPPPIKPVRWVGSARKDWRALPHRVQDLFGYGLYLAQVKEKATYSKVLKGFGSAGVLELVANQAGSTYRAVYTLKFAKVVYVLHVFQKKSKRGISTPQPDTELIQQRIKAADEDYQRWHTRT